MRIACLHIPQFALQSVTRLDPSLRGAPVAVVGAGLDPMAGTVARVALHSPIVQACSRAAWALGVRLGMTATQARMFSAAPQAGATTGSANASSTDLRLVTADAQAERDTVRAIADGALGVSGTVDLGGRVGAGGAHLAMYCEVPSKTRGLAFGERLVELLGELGLTARVGIADDRFTAWVAACDHAGTGRDGDDAPVVSVPRGGSAAFLAPRPLSLLAISPEVLHMLDALGVRTLGEFAALPAPSVARGGRSSDADLQALARGDSGQSLRPYAPDATIREEVAILPVLGSPSPAAAIELLARRCALRLAGRARGAARLELVIAMAPGTWPTPERVVPIVLDRAVTDADEIADAIVATGELGELGHITRMRLAVTGEAIAGEVIDAAADRAALDAEIVDALAVVLSTTASSDVRGAWQLTPWTPSNMRAERRDAHRRTQHGKQRRRAPIAQSRLFDGKP